MFTAHNRDLLIACLWASLAVIVVAATDNAFLRSVLCVPLAIVICGHALLRALGIGTTTVAERLAYAVGASLVVGIAGGMVLNAARLLSPIGWAGWFWLMTVGSSLVAACRGDCPWMPSAATDAAAAIDIRRWHVGAVASSLLILVGAYVLAIRDESAQRQFKYTQFWLLPADDGAQLRVGVSSSEDKSERFDLDIALDGQSLATFRSIEMAPGETWTRELPIAPAAVSRRAVARLYRPDDNRMYRSTSAQLAGR